MARLGAILRGVAVAFLVFVVGLVGLATVFSDPSPGETRLSRALVVVAVHVIGGVAVGALVERRYGVAVLQSWGTATLALWSLAVGWKIGHVTASPEFLVLCLLGAPLASLAGGLAGHRARAAVRR